MIYDPDYARAYSIIRCLAWSYGYAACLHGSFTRDLDVVLVPWTDTASDPVPLINLIAADTKTKVQGEPGQKPHGRQAWTLIFPEFGDPRWIDISVVPRGTKGGE
jgi:hypothetical protein